MLSGIALGTNLLLIFDFIKIDDFEGNAALAVPNAAQKLFFLSSILRSRCANGTRDSTSTTSMC